MIKGQFLLGKYEYWLDQGSPTVKAVATGTFWATVAFFTYETVKWGAAFVLAPETAGGSLGAASVVP